MFTTLCVVFSIVCAAASLFFAGALHAMTQARAGKLTQTGVMKVPGTAHELMLTLNTYGGGEVNRRAAVIGFLNGLDDEAYEEVMHQMRPRAATVFQPLTDDQLDSLREVMRNNGELLQPGSISEETVRLPAIPNARAEIVPVRRAPIARLEVGSIQTGSISAFNLRAADATGFSPVIPPLVETPPARPTRQGRKIDLD